MGYCLREETVVQYWSSNIDSGNQTTTVHDAWTSVNVWEQSVMESVPKDALAYVNTMIFQQVQLPSMFFEIAMNS